MGWTVDDCGEPEYLDGIQSQFTIMDDESCPVACCFDEDQARLIAAAPKLLSIAQRWAALDGGVWHAQRYISERADLLEATRVTIAKATES